MTQGTSAAAEARRSKIEADVDAAPAEAGALTAPAFQFSDRSDLQPAVLVGGVALALFGYLVLSAYILFFSGMETAGRAIYFALFTGLAYCSLAYLINRVGAARRNRAFVPARPEELDQLVAQDAPSVTVLIPSYREERRVLLMTVLSAALAPYAQRRIVVLVDDPPGSSSLPDSLATVREAAEIVSSPMAVLKGEYLKWQNRRAHGALRFAAETERLARHYEAVAEWLGRLSRWLDRQSDPAFAHVDRFFSREVVERLALYCRDQARHARALGADEAALDRHYLRLSTLFCADITPFERKQYSNLSHAPNKAMNLNAYLGLMGGRYVERQTAEGRVLEAVEDGEADLVAPATDYVLTLDADSVILPQYLQELVFEIERRPDAGVIQTPYMTFPNSVTAVERTAGATTDLQYLVHQGSSAFNAAHWVGANALLRFAALKDIVVERQEDGRTERVFIQDSTVIEDTGSTVDLLDYGWMVHNHPRRLAYSATPADFGSLAIQRQRWSNGGLIIFPMLLAQFGRQRRKGWAMELLLRSHYLLSPVVGNTAVFLLMVLMGADARNVVWAPVAMLPYFVIYGLDLKRNGYRFLDLFAVSSLNLMLLPVGFSGILASIRQLLTGKKGAFARTPKIAGRTGVHPVYILFNLAMTALMGWFVGEGIRLADPVYTILPALALGLYLYGTWSLVGVRAALVDLSWGLGQALSGAVQRLWRPLLAASVFSAATLMPLPNQAASQATFTGLAWLAEVSQSVLAIATPSNRSEGSIDD